jgi:hypothetical protein
MDFTFKGIKEELVQKLKEYSQWTNEILTLGVWSVLLDIVAFIIEKLGYNVDFRYQETTTNAVLRSSVVRISKDHGYIPLRKSGSVGYLILGSDENFTTKSLEYFGDTLQILRWNKFQSSDGNNEVYATQDFRLDPGVIQKRLNPDPGTQSLSIQNGTQTGLAVSGHGLQSGDVVYITGTRNLDGVWTLTDNTNSNRIVLLRDFTSETFTGFESIFVGFGIIPVREGNPQEFTYIATGNLNEKISLFSDSIDQFEIEVFRVDETGTILAELSIVEDLYFVNDTESETCEIENFPNYDGIWIKFGDGITSRRVQEDEIYLIKYAITKGSQGNIRSSDVITEPLSPFINVNNEIEDLFVTNVDPIIGGSDLETLLQIKKQYSRLYATGKQLTKRSAWIAAIEERQSVYRANVWTELDIDNGSISLSGTVKQNIHYISAVNTEGNALTPPQETDISTNQLIPRKSPTDIISWQKVDKIRIKLDILAEIENIITFADMKIRMIDTLIQNLGVLNLEFKEEVYDSNVVALIDNISDVIRHETDIYYAEEDIEQSQNLTDFLVSKTTNDLDPEDQIIVLTDSPKIMIRRKIADKWYSPLQISETSGVQMTGVNLFNVSGTVVYNGVDTSQITYQCFDLLQNIIPFFIETGTTQDSSQILNMISTAGIAEGMFVSGLNIVDGTQVLAVDTIGNSLVLSQPVGDSDSTTGEIAFSWFPDPEQVFGARNPDDSQSLGYILYLVYQTQDGNGNRVGDLRLSKFNQILDFSEDLSTFEYVYP